MKFTVQNLIKKLFIPFVIIILLTSPVKALDNSHNLDNASNYLETGRSDSAAVILYDLLDSIEDANEYVRALYLLSRAMDQLGRFADEIKYLIMAREESPGTEFADKVDLEYSRILLQTGNFKDCIGVTEEFRRLYVGSPLLPDILYIAGNAYFSDGEYHRAFNIFNEITESHENSDVSIESIMKKGMCLFHLNLIGGAIEQFEQYLTKSRTGRNTAETLFYLGVCYESTKQPEPAIELFKRLTIDYPSYPKIIETYFKLGMNYLESGQFPEAKNAFLNYIANTDETKDNHNEALLHIERIAFMTGIYSSETEIYENFIIKYPDNPLSPIMLFRLASYYRLAENTDEALEKYSILMTNALYSSYSDSATFLTADTYSSIDRRDEAITFLKQYAYIQSDTLKTQKYLLKIGSLYEKWELYETAISWYDSSFTLQASDELSVQALMGIGRIFKKLDRWMESGKTYERIIKLYPDISNIKDVYMALSDIFALMGRTKDAVLTAEKTVKHAREPEKTDILFYIANLYEGIDEDHALQLYSNIFNNKRNTSSQMFKALLKYGDLALRAGDSESAVKAYATVINSGADSVTAHKAREKLLLISEAVNDSIK